MINGETYLNEEQLLLYLPTPFFISGIYSAREDLFSADSTEEFFKPTEIEPYFESE